MKLDAKLQQIILRCKKSPLFFIDSYISILHPKAGLIPFNLFKYQKNSILKFLKNRFVIYRKCRQSGLSTLTGVYALWFSMFFNNKTILIVSKRDLDAKEYLKKNVKIPYRNMPSYMKDLWPPVVDNEHEIAFANGSKITSLSSSPDTLRSNASTLNILDEVAFMPHMKEMWAGGAPTVMHAGSIIAISTSNKTTGIGEWYYKTISDAEAGINEFVPITVNWWDMDWKIPFKDEYTGRKIEICPTKNIRKSKSENNEIEKFGPYWSPWIQEQYNLLTLQGDPSLFRQEFLHEFIGVGESVIPTRILRTIKATLNDDYKTVGQINYKHPVTSEVEVLDFQHKLYVWELPQKDHLYVIGNDISGGEAEDWSAIEVFDITAREQVAEFLLKEPPTEVAKYVDYIGRWYNTAFVVPERTGIGLALCQTLERSFAYPSLFRSTKNVADKTNKSKKVVGFKTTHTSKPLLNKSLVTHLDEDGFKIYSSRLHTQLISYVRLRAGRTGADAGCHDDLVIATALALYTINEAIYNTGPLPPLVYNNKPMLVDKKEFEEAYNEYVAIGGPDVLVPIIANKNSTKTMAIEEELFKFQKSLGGISINEIAKITVKLQKHKLNKPKPQEKKPPKPPEKLIIL